MAQERVFKDSGIEWIGKIPLDWELVRMKNIGEYINGYAFKPEDWSNSGLPIIRIQDLTGSNENPNYYSGILEDKYLISSGDILISWAATLDAFVWNKHTGWLNQHIFKASPYSNKVDKHFFVFLVKEAMANMNNDNKHGIVMQHVTLGVFNNFKVPIPSIKEQQAIADYLDEQCAKIDGAVEKQKQIIEKLKEYKKSLITETVTKGLNPNVKMKDSGIEWIGEMPEHWKICKLKNYALICNGADYKEHLSEDGKYPIIGSGGAFAKSDTFMYDKDSVLLGRKGTVDKPLFIQEPFWTIDTMYYTQIKETCVTKFFFYLCTTINFDFYQYGTALPSMTQRDLNGVSFTYPPLSEQQEISDYLDKKCDEIDSVIEKREKMIDLLTEYKKSLIYECVTGKKEVA